MTPRKLSKIRSEAGAVGGAVTSKAKARTARRNGALGGRPRLNLSVPEKHMLKIARMTLKADRA
jgi:hypothetical protein